VHIEEIKKIIAILEESNLKKIHLRDGEFEISIEKESKFSEKNHNISIHNEEEAIKKAEVEKESLASFATSPIVGTFYQSSAPDQSAFVKVGDVVDEDSVVCIVEAMKVMNEVKANVKGKVVEVLVDNAQPVEYGTKLFKIIPE